MLSRSTSTPCFPKVSSQGLQMYSMTAEEVASSSLDANSGSDSHRNSLLCSFSILKDKVHQVQSLISILISPNHSQTESSTCLATATVNTVIQEIIMTASSIMFTCQQMALGSTSGCTSNDEILYGQQQRQSRFPQPNFGGNSNTVGNIGQEREQTQRSFYTGDTLDNWDAETCNAFGNIKDDNRSVIVGNNRVEGRSSEVPQVMGVTNNELAFIKVLSSKSDDIIELEAADLLAKYTHYCKVCAKGFKRDANLRMHMRAHGDEYKTSAALSNPMKNESTSDNKEGSTIFPRKYSCPQEGCRWNRKHAKFQPLKSLVCVKNHYKRSHCPKLYVCKRCSQKQFSVLSDLRTHEKHCGDDQKWQCSCGTTFSRKDKLMGHVALFIGHTPAITSLTKLEKMEPQALKQCR
ncbi:hypothetical protein I3760_13G121200 [Carya illinoinensis]|nr:hypothetical protein I3760_13G121200 [Carya illinoinensis]